MLEGLSGYIAVEQDVKYQRLLHDISIKLAIKQDPSLAGAEYKLKRSSTLEYAVYQLVKSLQLDPTWLLLMIGDTSTWGTMLRRFHLINERAEPFLDPRLILVLVLNLRSLPVVLKELYCDYNWVQTFL
jgi:hypothetical protein